MDRRLAELRNLNESATRGRVKSQRGGPGEISVKRVVDWPQNFILTGTNKTRPTYDDLSMTQWMAVFIRCIQEEKQECNRASMLDYLGNLMGRQPRLSMKFCSQHGRGQVKLGRYGQD